MYVGIVIFRLWIKFEQLQLISFDELFGRTTGLVFQNVKQRFGSAIDNMLHVTAGKFLILLIQYVFDHVWKEEAKSHKFVETVL